MADFDELNKIKVKETHIEEGDRGLMIGAEKVNTYKFYENKDIALNKSWTVEALFSEFRKINTSEEDQTIDDRKARALEKKNSKYSAKDRKKSVARSKDIRNRKMAEVDFDNMMGHGILKSGELLKLEKKYIELDAEAREEYIKAYMVDDDKYAIDISMNKMRKYYRLIRMYIDHSRDEGISERTRNGYANEIKKLRAKLDKEMKEIRNIKGYGKYFTWEKVTGHVKEKAKHTAQQNIARDNVKADEIREARQAEKQRRLNAIDARRQMVISGKWAGDDGEEKEIDSDWKLTEFSAFINNELFTDKEHDLYTDEQYRAKLSELNGIVKENLKALDRMAVKGMINSIRGQEKNKQSREMLISFLDAGVPWVKKYCVDMHKAVFGNNLLVGKSVENTLKKSTMAIKKGDIAPFYKAAGRWSILQKADLGGRGVVLAKSKALLKLLGPDEETEALGLKDEDLTNMVRRAQGTDRLLRRMVVERFGRFAADDIYKDLRNFIGDKALFAGNRVIKDYAERYLNGLALTNRKYAQKQKAYDEAYKNRISGPFSEVMRPAIEKYLLSRKDKWDEAGNQQELMERELEVVALYLAGMEKALEGKTLSEQGWKKLYKACSKFLTDKVGSLKRESDDVMIQGFAAVVERSTKVYFDEDEGGEKISCYEYCGKRKKAVKEPGVDTLTFGEMIKQLINGDKFSAVIPDTDIRKFLADNLNVILFRNPVIREKFPFMKDIKGIDGLDDLGFDQVENMAAFLFQSISEKGMAKEIQEALDGYKVEPEVQKRALLEVMRTGAKKADVKKIFQAEYDKKSQQNKLARKKLLVTIGTDKEMRDGKLRYRYEDMPDREKTLAQSLIGWDKDWMRNRAAHANKATEVWKKLEEIGPEAVAQVRQWLKSAIDSDNPHGSLMELAQALQGDKKKFKVFKVKVKANANVVTDAKLASKDGEEQFLNAIREAFLGTKESDAEDELEAIEKKKKKKTEKEHVKVTDFIYEMCMFGVQDILMGHGGEFQEDFFAYGDDPEEMYRDKLFGIAKFAFDRTEVIENMIKDYPPELQPQLRNKLAKTVLTMRNQYFQAEKESLAELPKMQKQISDLEKSKAKLAEENDTFEKDITEAKKAIANAEDSLDKLKADYESAKQQRQMIEEAIVQSEKNIEELKKDKKNEKKDKVNKKSKSEKKEEKKAAKEAEQIVGNSLNAQLEEYRQREYSAHDKLLKAQRVISEGNDTVTAALEKINLNNGKAKDIQKKIKAVEKDIESFSIGDKAKYSYKEQRVNLEAFGVQNLQQLGDMLHSLISAKDGKQSDELFETARLYKERRNLLAQYKDGLLEPLADTIMGIPKLTIDILDSAETVATECIEKLYARFAPLGMAIKDQNYSFVGEFFTEDYLKNYLDEEKADYKEYEKVLQEDDPKMAVKYWKRKLDDFTGLYLTQSKQNTKSILSNLEQGAESAQKSLTYYFKAEEENPWFDKIEAQDAKERNKLKKEGRSLKFKIGNVVTFGLTAKLDSISDSFDRGKRKANGLIKQMNDHLLASSDTLQAANLQGTLEAYYEGQVKNYKANDSLAQETFLKYLLTHTDSVSEDLGEVLSQGFESNIDVRKTISSMTFEQQRKLQSSLEDFRGYIRDSALTVDPKTFKQKLDKTVGEFLSSKKTALEEDVSFRPESIAEAKERIKQMQEAQTAVAVKKSEGRTLYNEKLFAGKLDTLKELGQIKTSLIYAPQGKKGEAKVGSKGEEKDKSRFAEAKQMFRKEGDITYPDILADCLDEYVRLNSSFLTKADRAADWVLGEDNDVKIEAERLKGIYKYAAGEAKIPEEAMDLYLVYAAKFQEKTGTGDNLKKLTSKFKNFYVKLSELEKMSFNDSGLILAHRDICEKMRAYIISLNGDQKAFAGMIDAQKKYLSCAEKAYGVIDKVLAEDAYTKDLDVVSKSRYVGGLREYFTGSIITASEGELDPASFAEEVKERISTSFNIEALLVKGDSVSNKDFEEQNTYPGVKTRKDFEHMIGITSDKWLVEKYNELDSEQRKIFAIALYASRPEERGTQRAVYGMKADVIKTERKQILDYIAGKPGDLQVDYARSIRAVTLRYKNFRLTGDEELFKTALQFVEKVEKKKNLLRPKDFDRMNAAEENMKVADRYRKDTGTKSSKIGQQSKTFNKAEVYSQSDLYRFLGDYSQTDIKREGDQGLVGRVGTKVSKLLHNRVKVENVKARFDKMSSSQRGLLIYILQNRTILDFSSAGKDEKTKKVPHVDSAGRFKMYEKLLSEEGRIEALRDAADPEFVQKALASLLSFQVRDDVELPEGELRESDFVESSINRIRVVDWDLLDAAMDFLAEIDRERIKKFAVRQSRNLLRQDAEEKKDKKTNSARFYSQHKSLMETGASSVETFENMIISAFEEDKLNNGQSNADDLLTGYYKLNANEKKLFIKALENRDILDVSQKNLYKNVFGLAERDFVNPVDRDALIDEYLANGNDTELGEGACMAAFESLLSREVNDDMKFENVDINWANKNLYVNNQLLVTDRKTVIDWKLFERALQFVTRTTSESKMVSGDQAVYESLGDKQKNGEFKMDNSFLRVNLHHTGSRFMRFLAREGYDEIKDNLGFFDTAVGFADYIVSQKTANFLHDQANEMLEKDKEKEDDLVEDMEVEEEKPKDGETQEQFEARIKKEKEEAFKRKNHDLRGIYDLAGSFQEQKEVLKTFGKNIKSVIGAYKDVLDDKEEEKELSDGLSETLKGVEATEIVNHEITGYKYVDMVLRFSGKAIKGAADAKAAIDAFAENDEQLEKIDGYIEKYMKGFVSTKAIGEWYTDKAEAFEQKVDDLLPDFVKNNVTKLLKAAEETGDLLDWAKTYVNPVISMIGDFKDIVEASINIKKLGDARDEGAKKSAEDKSKIENLNVSQKKKVSLTEVLNNNKALVSGGTDMTKNIESRKISKAAGTVAGKVAEYAGVEGASKIIDKVVDLANYFWHCMSDKNTVRDYYQGAGNATVKDIYAAREQVEEKFRYHDKPESYVSKHKTKKDVNGNIVVGSRQLDLIRNAQGFERDEELVDFIRLNMVHAILFSASDYNPFEEPRILAKCTLAVLGLEDAIGKTDNETAVSVFKKLRE